jgi:hypothetical protein
MTKRYILSIEDLQNLIHEWTSFAAEKTKKQIQLNKRIMFSDRIKWINEFLQKHLIEYPIDKLLSEIESSFTGRSIDEIKNDLKNKEHTASQAYKNAQDYLKQNPHQ